MSDRLTVLSKAWSKPAISPAWVANLRRRPERVCLQSRSLCLTTVLRSLTAISLCFSNLAKVGAAGTLARFFSSAVSIERSHGKSTVEY